MEEGGLTGSSAADSQLAAAMSQSRFQSAAFSSSPQTATKPLWIKTRKKRSNSREENVKNTRKKKKKTQKNPKNRGTFPQSSDGVAQRKLSADRHLPPRQRGRQKTGRLRGSAGPDKFDSTPVFQTALPTANTASTEEATRSASRRHAARLSATVV